MKYRSLLLGSALLQAGLAHGVGLGNIQVESFLGAPLKASANLVSTAEYGEREIKAKIASIEVYDRFGARFEPQHNHLQFSVVENANGELNLTIGSTSSIVEPFLDIVVELSWPEGTTYRRYNLLLDPPQYAAKYQRPQQQLTPVETATSLITSNIRQKIDKQINTVTPKIALGDSYQVQKGDSLWKLAKHSRKAAGLSQNQMMDVLFENNANAFVGGDKSKLKLGAVIQVPSQGALASLETFSSASYGQQVAKVDVPSTDAVLSEVEPLAFTDKPLPQLPVMGTTLLQQDLSTATVEDIDALKLQLAQLLKEREQIMQFQQKIRDKLTSKLSPAWDPTQIQSELSRNEKAPSTTLAPDYWAEPLRQEPTQQEPSPQEPLTQATPQTPNEALMGLVSEGSILKQQNGPAATAAMDLIANRDLKADNGVMNSRGLWYALGLIPMGILIALLGMRAHRVQEMRRDEQGAGADLYDVVFGSKRDRTRSDAPEQIKQAMQQIRKKADQFEEQTGDNKAISSEPADDDVSKMIELYLVYSQYQKALNVILTEISKYPTRKDLRLYLMQVYAFMEDWKAFEEQLQVLEKMGDPALVASAKSIRNEIIRVS